MTYITNEFKVLNTNKIKIFLFSVKYSVLYNPFSENGVKSKRRFPAS